MLGHFREGTDSCSWADLGHFTEQDPWRECLGSGKEQGKRQWAPHKRDGMSWNFEVAKHKICFKKGQHVDLCGLSGRFGKITLEINWGKIIEGFECLVTSTKCLCEIFIRSKSVKKMWLISWYREHVWSRDSNQRSLEYEQTKNVSQPLVFLECEALTEVGEVGI